MAPQAAELLLAGATAIVAPTPVDGKAPATNVRMDATNNYADGKSAGRAVADALQVITSEGVRVAER